MAINLSDEHYILHKNKQLLVFHIIGESDWVNQIILINTSGKANNFNYVNSDTINLYDGPEQARDIWDEKVIDGWERVK